MIGLDESKKNVNTLDYWYALTLGNPNSLLYRIYRKSYMASRIHLCYQDIIIDCHPRLSVTKRLLRKL